MWNLAQLYENGQGVERDLRTARAWYRKASDAGDSESKKWLAEHPEK
jgi:TPR repeat protein